MFRKKRPRKYHYTITIHSLRTGRWASIAATIDWSGTRSEAFDHIFADACEKANLEVSDTSVLIYNWTFERDCL
jgi:hypothetical protein